MDLLPGCAVLDGGDLGVGGIEGHTDLLERQLWK